MGSANKGEGDALAAQLGVAAPVARLLVQRGFSDPQMAHQFLNPSPDQLHSPDQMPDMARAAARIAKALDDGETIGVYGDYDVDGVTSAALLGRVLGKLASSPDKVVVRVPHRRRDGYGLSPETMDMLHAEGATVIVSADCGVSAHEAALRAKALGIDLIVTDHHEPGDTLPDAYAVVNPKRADSTYPFRDLAGVGVAFKVGEAVAALRGIAPHLYRPRFLDLVALGTVADNAPLVDENRAMARIGLASLSQTKKAGLRTLLAATGVISRPITAGVVSFNIAPRLNAVGRVDDAALGLELLMTSDGARAQELVALLERLNDERRTEQERIWGEAMDSIRKQGLHADKVILVSGANWHKGVVGIVAGRLADRFHRPALVVATDDTMARGSARSATNFPVIDALRDCHDILKDYGGHSQAAGFDLLLENLPQLRERLNLFADHYLTDEDVLPTLDVDMEILPQEICTATLRDLARMEPFGSGNREPVWVSRNLLMIGSSCFGKQTDRPHLSMKMRGEGMDPTECVWWRQASRQGEFAPNREFDVVFRMEPNHFGAAALRLNVQDAVPSESSFDAGFAEMAADPVWEE